MAFTSSGTGDIEWRFDRTNHTPPCRAERVGLARLWRLQSRPLEASLARRHDANLARTNARADFCFEIMFPTATLVRWIQSQQGMDVEQHARNRHPCLQRSCDRLQPRSDSDLRTGVRCGVQAGG